MLEAVAAEAVDQEKAVDARGRADDRIRVRRDLVETGPGVRYRGFRKRRKAPDVDVDHLRQKIPLHGHVERRRLVPVAHAEQQPRALAVKVERRLEIDDEDARRGNRRRAAWPESVEGGNEDVAAERIH